MDNYHPDSEMKRNRLLQNTGANMSGRLVSAGSNIIAAPIILHAIGREGFGVVTFTLSFLSLSALLDLGLAATANRAIAQSRAIGGEPSDQADLLRTFEIIYWTCAAIIIASTFVLSGWVARDWLQLSTLRPSDAALVFSLTGLMIGLRFPVGLYSGVLFGLRRHGYQNLIFGGFSAVRYLGGAALVCFVSPSVITYSKWLAITGLAEIFISVVAAWALIGGGGSFLAGSFKKAILIQHWRFSFVFAATGAVGSFWASSDRIFLANLLPATDLGLYGLLYTPAGALTMVSSALAVAAFPEFAAVTSAPGLNPARALYVRIQMLTAVCILTISIPLAVHYGPILRIWTRDTANVCDGLVPGMLLVAAMAVNALANPAYTFLVASGRPHIALAWNLVALVITTVGLFSLVPWLGLPGAALSVLITNIIGLVYFVFNSKRILKSIGTRAHFGRVLLLGCSLCLCNLIVAVACHSDWVEVVTGIASSCIISYLFVIKFGVLEQVLCQSVGEVGVGGMNEHDTPGR